MVRLSKTDHLANDTYVFFELVPDDGFTSDRLFVDSFRSHCCDLLFAFSTNIFILKASSLTDDFILSNFPH
jgi:hypothetical protein